MNVSMSISISRQLRTHLHLGDEGIHFVDEVVPVCLRRSFLRLLPLHRRSLALFLSPYSSNEFCWEVSTNSIALERKDTSRYKCTRSHVRGVDAIDRAHG